MLEKATRPYSLINAVHFSRKMMLVCFIVVFITANLLTSLLQLQTYGEYFKAGNRAFG